jgi:hypothetical protein
MATYNYKGVLLMQQMYNFSWVNTLPRWRSLCSSTVEALNKLVHMRTSCDLRSALWDCKQRRMVPRCVKSQKSANLIYTDSEASSCVKRFLIAFPHACNITRLFHSAWLNHPSNSCEGQKRWHLLLRTGMRRITTFRLTTDSICDGGPIIL